jgi:hypothetical protein
LEKNAIQEFEHRANALKGECLCCRYSDLDDRVRPQREHHQAQVAGMMRQYWLQCQLEDVLYENTCINLSMVVLHNGHSHVLCWTALPQT